MIVYLSVDLIDRCESDTAYYSVHFSPNYAWRYSNYETGINFYRTYVHRGLMRISSEGISLAVL